MRRSGSSASTTSSQHYRPLKHRQHGEKGERNDSHRKAQPPSRELVLQELARLRDERLEVWRGILVAQHKIYKLLHSSSGYKALEDEKRSRMKNAERPSQYGQRSVRGDRRRPGLSERRARVQSYKAMAALLIQEFKANFVSSFRKKRPPLCDIYHAKGKWCRIDYKAPKLDPKIANGTPEFIEPKNNEHFVPPRPKGPISMVQFREPFLLGVVDHLVRGLDRREAAKQLAVLDMTSRMFCYGSLSITELVAREIFYRELPETAVFAGRSWKWTLYSFDMTIEECLKVHGGEYNASRKCLNLAWKNIGDTGVSCLAAALRSADCKPIDELRLSDNQITGYGVKFFSMVSSTAAGAATLAGIRSLNLEDNNIGKSKGVEMLAKMLPRLPALQELFLSGNGIATRPALYLFRATILHPKLRVLGLGGNSIDSIKPIFEMLKSKEGMHMKTLLAANPRTLYLSGNNIPDSQLKQLRKDNSFIVF